MEIYHNNAQLSATEKLQYLKSCLDGEAFKLIAHYDTTAANYVHAWNALVERYENKELLLGKQLNKLMELPVVQTESSYHLKRMHDTIKEVTYALTCLEIDYSNWDPILLHILTKKPRH